jgi:hypothetical protein
MISFDLIHAKEFDRKVEFNSKEWIEKGLKKLFPSSVPSEPVREEVDKQISARSYMMMMMMATVKGRKKAYSLRKLMHQSRSWMPMHCSRQ